MILKAGYKFLAYVIFPVIAVVTYGAFMRYVFHAMPNWCFEISIFLFGIYIMIGGAYIYSEQKHIRVDILERYFPQKVNTILRFVSELIVIFTCVMLIYISSPWVWDSFLLKEKSVHQTSFNPPIWWFKAIIPISAALILFHSLRKLISVVRKKP